MCIRDRYKEWAQQVQHTGRVLSPRDDEFSINGVNEATSPDAQVRDEDQEGHQLYKEWAEQVQSQGRSLPRDQSSASPSSPVRVTAASQVSQRSSSSERAVAPSPISQVDNDRQSSGRHEAQSNAAERRTVRQQASESPPSRRRSPPAREEASQAPAVQEEASHSPGGGDRSVYEQRMDAAKSWLEERAKSGFSAKQAKAQGQRSKLPYPTPWLDQLRMLQ
eukprot:TRINITY_DN6123_c0_g1_i1.p1 TRINITY_DN6123_c0_g1~~TRINITY_DN6123_c0_g1_i1.p1  ORF type:complete len:221 (-),score=42.72 TRINITY_DN6123_c0_g1_i1:61-723(-)